MCKKVKPQTNYVQHFSTRIPWKDNDYTGRIDNNPRYNVAAQVIPNIASSRDLEFEETNKGKSYEQVGPVRMQSWITENAAFMSDTKLYLKMNHPYKKGNAKFKHFEETTFEMDPYSFLLRPFSWTLKDNANKKQKYYNFYFDLEKTEQMLSWSSSWVSHGESQKGIFDYFFSGVSPHNSLIFPYYKQVPFIEDNRRVIAGIGNIVSNVEIHEYETDGSSDEKNYIWETNAAHSIRIDGKDGFLMPYHEISEYVKKHPDTDVSSVTLFEAAGFRTEFSYAAEWVSYDAAIDVLNQAKIALKNIAKLKLKEANHEWVNVQLEYVENQLKSVWNQRGIFPGLGSILSAFGVRYGFDVAKHVDTCENGLISELKLHFSGDKETGNEKLDNSLADKEDEFSGLLRDEDKTRFFELLSRLNLSVEQAIYAWGNLKNYAAEIIKNPYRLYELTRKEKDEHQVTISQIDNAMFVNPLVENRYPLKKPTKMRTESDKRRFRAMVIFVLVQAANQGHTLLSYDQIVEEINKLPLDNKTDFQTEKIEGVLEFLQEGELHVDVENTYIKLKEYQDYKQLVVDIVNSRLGTSLSSEQNWRKIICDQFGELEKNNEENDELARDEKATALKIIESSRISVLLGRAGTGKTLALGVFASSKEIKAGGVLALTPTGKARVQLENSFKKNSVEAEFMTVAQFLIRSKGFSLNTMAYKMPSQASSSIAKTVIIDESSMLTEDMFAGILKLVDSHAERIIFIGDPNQLPPIGAGRPFIDLTNYLESAYPEKVATLKTEMRQGSGGDDLSFAQIFSNSDSVDKDVVYRIQNNQTDNRLKYIQYTDLDELEKVFFEELVEIANMTTKDDIDGFNKSLGAEKNGKYTNYNTGRHIEDWQILSPTKFIGTGSYYLNNQIHQKYRQKTVKDWQTWKWKNKYEPQSVQNIVLGDKVISNRNENREAWDKTEEYIANGELGILSRAQKNGVYPASYSFRFGSFEGKVFSYTKADFGGDNSDSKLELAYALTVHKSQGSGFGKTIVVINGKSLFVTKELLYTAFSRQREKLIVLSDLSIQELVQYANDWYSDTKQRYTDLFEVPNIIEIEFSKQKRYFEEKLIHKTIRGEMVRSKSEVIVANILDKMKIEYIYEESLNVSGKTYIPDFTLRYKGKTAYLEHLGMLRDKSYKKHWDEKRANYESVGISETLGNLIITEDGLDGSLDAMLIGSKIQTWIKNS
ncbi:AAA family ATPase [Clostridium estertheticum]|uniref:AAA family ATPase n=1 Tax=Clostridium estertheticum TaxID=238834 RepID=UPI001C0B5E71|nr:AAA family ATPase [Clostridium estertheticum]MBU3214780.1 AAA family ATPase [Clostridium estertheticum]WAG57192.1 AAA family ATPase [Clostridium estertheticum]